MYLPSVLGIAAVLRRRPELLKAARVHLVRRLRQRSQANGAGQRSGPPEQLTVVVSDACNLRCHMCQYAYSDRPGYRLGQSGHMPAALFDSMLSKLEGSPLISFTGGEPLLHPKIDRFVAHARAQGHLTTLTTNGWFLATKAAALCQAGLDLLVVSVDGPQQIHDRIRGARVFDRLVAGVRAIMKRPDRPIVIVSMTISDLNHDQLAAVHELAREWQVDALNFSHLWMQTDEMVDACQALFPTLEIDRVAWQLQPNGIDTERVSEDLARIQRRNWRQRLIVTETPYLTPAQRRTWYQNPTEFVRWRSAQCAWVRMKVWPDGRVKACRDRVVGNLLTEGPMAIWHGQAMRDFRQFLVEHGTLPICARCCYMAHR